MIYIFQRIIQNQFQWTRPSAGRLGPLGEGKYVKENGFGHEDWNFNKNLLINGSIYGYCYYEPSEEKRDKPINIAFASYTNKKWFLTGFYLNSNFVDDPPIQIDILEKKMNDLLLLGKSLGKPWLDLDEKDFIKKLKEEAKSLKWCVSPINAIRTAKPVEIPSSIYKPRNYRISRPTEINQQVFDSLYKLAEQSPQEEDYGIDSEFPEGKEKERKHISRERNQAVIKTAKELFKAKHGKLFCQICGFDFYTTYGEIGFDYIEGHHTLPISELEGTAKTKVKDIALVCSNCHRMLHRKRPWLEMSELKNLVNKIS